MNLEKITNSLINNQNLDFNDNKNIKKSMKKHIQSNNNNNVNSVKNLETDIPLLQTIFDNDVKTIKLVLISEEEALSIFSCSNQEKEIEEVMNFIKNKYKK
jgi:hypothetical protein